MDYKRMIDERNASGYINHLDINVVEIREGYAKTEVLIGDGHINPMGAAHGGLIFSLADVTAGSCANSFGNKASTLNSSINFLAPAMKGSKLTGESKLLKNGKTVKVIDVEIKDESGKMVARGNFSFFDLGEPLFED
ncbi:acyl-CoA thioesterase [Peptoniphilus asaccharolyticus DSM 20463]|uniref:Acyl-CoA thioesterase n=1 Tax=Peptoniphilus asaccharolyticus DSM 20463 TaxID=573058 RepID=A0A1W1VJB5_PEPAS|nr:PaaI family thioesterase [Peptoniphilus asaccharolyticus]MBL7574401.1 PaaI family thioesterase [Peptoniphilus asaccharolyticus]SMB93467.1 acyl-CoA thioesterase [Peptoniphilus asaccharolyticus DSM 20463]